MLIFFQRRLWKKNWPKSSATLEFDFNFASYNKSFYEPNAPQNTPIKYMV